MMSRDAEALLSKGRNSPPRPSEASRARMREQVLARVGAAALAGASAATVAKASPSAAAGVAKVALAWKLFGVVVVASGLAGGAVALREPTPAEAPNAAVVDPVRSVAPQVSPPPPPSVAALVPAEPPAGERPAEATPQPAAEHAPAARSAASVKPPAVTSGDGLAEEAALLKEAQAALGAGNGAKALALTNEHASRFPSGALASERRLIRALALCATGNKAQGSNEGRAAFPDENGAARKRIEAACQ